MTDTVRWRTTQQGIAACEDCIRRQPEFVGGPLAVGEIPDPPAAVDVMFIGVAPTSLNGKHKGRHFWSNVEVVIDSCARRHLVEEIIAIRPRAVCFLGHNTAPAAALLGLAIDDRIAPAKVMSQTAEWTGLGLATVQPIRGADRRAGPAIRRIFVQLGMLEQ